MISKNERRSTSLSICTSYHRQCKLTLIHVSNLKTEGFYVYVLIKNPKRKHLTTAISCSCGNCYPSFLPMPLPSIGKVQQTPITTFIRSGGQSPNQKDEYLQSELFSLHEQRARAHSEFFLLRNGSTLAWFSRDRLIERVCIQNLG
jgi:hypothetical protein